MTEVKKESLSALIDGEASEIEVHRLVREFRSDESLARSWTVFQHIRGTVRSSDEVSRLSPDHHLALFERISSAIDKEEDHQQDRQVSGTQSKMVLGSLALAASLVVAVFIGVQQPMNESSTGAQLAGNEASVTSPVSVQTVAYEGSQEITSELVELDEDKQRQLRAYLSQHDKLSRMNNDAQLVNYKGNNGK